MRLDVTRRSDLAVRALTVLGGADDRMKAPALAAALGTTPAFVTQVVAPLVRAGWLRSEPGPTGGYELVASLDDLSVLDVIEAVDGRTDAGRCVVENRRCDPTAACLLHDAWGAARRELTDHLAAVPVASLPPRPAPTPAPSAPRPASATSRQERP